MAFQKGQSGNPAGRRVEDSTAVKALAREHTEEAVHKLVEWMRTDNPKASVSACTALLDRGWGKPAQIHGGDEENPVRHIAEVRFIAIDPPTLPDGT